MILRFRGLFFGNPSPDGRGCREAAGEGYSIENVSKNSEETYVVPLTRPAVAGHPLPTGEGFAQSHFAILDSCAWPGGATGRTSESLLRFEPCKEVRVGCFHGFLDIRGKVGGAFHPILFTVAHSACQ